MHKYAICINAGPSNAGSAVNGFEYARSLLDAGHEVIVFIDGEATKWPGEVSSHPDHPVKRVLEDLLDQEAIGSACAYCADVYGAIEDCKNAGIPLSGKSGESHGPDMGELASNGYNLLNIG